MAVDLTIEVFSVDLYRRLWYELKLIPFVLPRYKNYDEIIVESMCNEAVIHAVLFRRGIFATFLSDDILLHYEIYSKSCLDFYLYLENNMAKLLPYNELSIFDKILMTCYVVMEMGNSYAFNSNTMYCHVCPLSFAMYFDTKLKKEFYKEGGWRKFQIHVNNYFDIISSLPYNWKNILNIKGECYKLLMNEYCFERIIEEFSEKIIKEKRNSSCRRCLPLFHVMNMLAGAKVEFVTEFQLSEGYLQFTLHMSSIYELQKAEKYSLLGTKFETLSEMLETVELQSEKQKTEQQSDEISYDNFFERHMNYRTQNTHKFLSRLYKEHDIENISDRCMFCAHAVNELPQVFKSVSDFRVKRIKSVIHNLMIDVKLKDQSSNTSLEDNMESSNKKKDNDVKAVLKLFFPLGVEPLKSKILIKMEKWGKIETDVNNLVDSLFDTQTLKVREDEVKENTGKKKLKKKKK